MKKTYLDIIEREESRVAKEKEREIGRVPGRVSDDFNVIWINLPESIKVRISIYTLFLQNRFHTPLRLTKSLLGLQFIGFLIVYEIET